MHALSQLLYIDVKKCELKRDKITEEVFLLTDSSHKRKYECRRIILNFFGAEYFGVTTGKTLSLYLLAKANSR